MTGTDYAGFLAVPAFLAFFLSLMGLAAMAGWLLRGIWTGWRRRTLSVDRDRPNPIDSAGA